MTVISDADFQAKVLAYVVDNAQITLLAIQLGISVLELGAQTRIQLAHLALHAYEVNNGITLATDNENSNAVLASMVSKITPPPPPPAPPTVAPSAPPPSPAVP